LTVSCVRTKIPRNRGSAADEDQGGAVIGVNVSFFYVWDSTEAANEFFSDEVRGMVAGLYGVAPTIEFVEIAQIVDNSGA